MIDKTTQQIGREWYELTTDKTFKSFPLENESFQVWKRKIYTSPFLSVKRQFLQWREDSDLLLRVNTGSPDVTLLQLGGLSPVIQSRGQGESRAVFTKITLTPQHWSTTQKLNSTYNIIVAYWCNHTSPKMLKEYSSFLKDNNIKGYLNLNYIKYCEGLTLECLMFESTT